ncbi:Profilin family protein [Zea mays]|uniref:Profilin family protein n=1 Tax=Zea mays TaxID=4577 RepID=A0A1D6M0H9_MAIZE|nr:Profilin family protein [Zea mays]
MYHPFETSLQPTFLNLARCTPQSSLWADKGPTVAFKFFDLLFFVIVGAEQEGTQLSALDMQPLLDFVKRGNLQTELFSVGLNQHLVTSIHENWFCARCINSTKPEGEGVIVMQIGACLLVTMYAGSLAAASQAMVAADQFAIQFNRRSH